MLLRNEQKYTNAFYTQPPTSDMCNTRQEYREKCIISNVVTANEELFVWDTLYFGKRKTLVKKIETKTKKVVVEVEDVKVNDD